MTACLPMVCMQPVPPFCGHHYAMPGRRTLRSPAQVVLSQGEACEAALAAAPCPDPLWLCGGTLTISNSVYQAARAGLCGTAANATQAGVCETLESYPDIQQLVDADRCTATCLAQVQQAQPARGAAPPAPATLAPPPPPPSAGGCWTYWLQLDVATEAQAGSAAAALHSATMAGALQDNLRSFFAPGKVTFVIGDSGE